MEIFHVHTFRCGHAEEVPDEEYIKLAAELGADGIWFTDHAPFPYDPFGARMKYSQLEEYLTSLASLKRKYTDISVHIGLETEYFPNFDRAGYYDKLRSMTDIEMLLLGQHMAETSSAPPAYSFSESKEYLAENEYRLLGNAIVSGIRSGYFNAVAHPDRIFRRCTKWTEDMESVSLQIIDSAIEADIPIEMNLSSVEDPEHYKTQFWKLVPDNAKRIIGFDAHCLKDMKSRYCEMKERLSKFSA